MPRYEREYREHRFNAETVRLAYELFRQLVAGEVPEERRSTLQIDGQLRRLNEALEFFEVYTPAVQSAELSVTYKTSLFSFAFDGSTTRVEVGLPDATEAAAIIDVFQAAIDGSIRRRVIFVGHGRDPAWKQLSAYLSAHADWQVRTYEESIAPGVTAIELLEQLASEVDFAILVHTRDAIESPNDSSPSANVIHETGFFHGALGRHRTLVVRERGCMSFHNIAGIHEVTFEPNAMDDALEQVMLLIERAPESSP